MTNMSNPQEEAPTIYLIDGHAQIFRAYFAIRTPMNSPVTGEPTQAVYGFAGMLFKLYLQYRPTHVAMAIDMPGKTFRDELYADYKAQREPPPDDFHPQEQRILEMTRLFGIPILGVSGAEADDVIATCTRRILADSDRAETLIRIVSRDKDLEQLLSDRVSMFDIHKDEMIDANTLSETKGIRPDQVIDMLTLTGDTVDNIPGVAGIGPKTASKLIKQYGSIDGILAHLDEIKGKRKTNIESARDCLPLNRQLVTLKHDVELDFTLDDARTGHIDGAGLRKLFETLGFRRYTHEVDALMPTTQSPPTPATASAGTEGFDESLFAIEATTPVGTGESAASTGYEKAEDCAYRAITTREQLTRLVQDLRAAPIISVDTETIGLGRRAALCGLAFSWREREAVYVPVKSPNPTEHLDQNTVLGELRPLLEDPDVGKCGHNLKYDALVLRHADIRLRGIVFDSMIASQLLGTSAHNLDHLAGTELHHAMIPISRLIGPRDEAQKTLDQIPLDQVTPYAAEDADVALRLFATFQPRLAAEGMAALADVEMPLVEVLADMESNGIRIDPGQLLSQKTELTGRIDQLRARILESAGESFNLDSPKQLADILFNKLDLPVGKRKKTGPSTDVEVLEKLANREDLPPEKTLVPRLIVEYRQLAKLVNTYLDNLRHSIYKADGRIHASFVQLGAATGRLSSGGPNLQNIPVRTKVGRQIRKAFVAEPGHLLICADYSQIELRILAHLSEDPALTAAFTNDMDIHTAVAAEVFGVPVEEVTPEQRGHAKVINFGIIYGVTAYGLARRIEGLDQKSAQELINDYRRRFPGIDDFLHHCVDQALNQGYVATILGRRRRIEQIHSRNGSTRALGERLAINTVVQGSATGDLIKTAMVNLYRRIYREDLPLKILVQIHDELILEAPADIAQDQAAIVEEEMERAMQMRVPLKVDVGIGADWFSAK